MQQYGFHDAPEVYAPPPQPSTLPEVVSPHAYGHKLPPGNAVVGIPQQSTGHGGGGAPWFRRRGWLFALVAAILVIVAAVGIGVGVGIGTKKGGGSSSSGPQGSSGGSDPESLPGGNETTPSARSPCSGTVCPSVLSTVRFVNGSSLAAGVTSMFVFGMGADGAAWVRHADATSGAWTSGWTSLGGSFVSQPVAVSDADGRVDVFGIWRGDNSTRTKAFRNGAWDAVWLTLGGVCWSVPAVVSWGPGRIDVLLKGTDNATWQAYYEAATGWHAWFSLAGGLSASPAAVARAYNRISIVVYGFHGDSYPVYHKYWNGASWVGYDERGGDFRGDPDLVAVNSDSVMFFGVGGDGAMYTFTWSESGGYSVTTNLGRVGPSGPSFESKPVAVASAGGQRVHVFALGPGGRLYYKALLANGWSADWMDLGGSFGAAPAAVPLADGGLSIALYGVGADGAVSHAIFTPTAGGTLSTTQAWTTDGGTISLSYFRVGPAR